MRIARTSRTIDLRHVPIDGFDMFILSRVDEPLSVQELAEILPCQATETLERVLRLARLGLVTVSADQSSEGRRPRRRDERAGASDATVTFDEAVTMKPPPQVKERDAPFADAPASGVRRGLAPFAPRARKVAR